MIVTQKKLRMRHCLYCGSHYTFHSNDCLEKFALPRERANFARRTRADLEKRKANAVGDDCQSLPLLFGLFIIATLFWSWIYALPTAVVAFDIFRRL